MSARDVITVADAVEIVDVATEFKEDCARDLGGSLVNISNGCRTKAAGARSKTMFWRKHLFLGGLAMSAMSCGNEETARATPNLINCPELQHRYNAAAVADAPLERGPFEDHINQAWKPGTELIEVRWLPINSIAGLHESLIYTDSNSEQLIIAGFPENGHDWLLRFGTVVMQVGPFSPTGRFSEDLSSRSRRKIIAQGKDLSGIWSDMKDVAEVIDELGVDYDLVGANSNSSSETVLKYAGLPASNPGLFGDFSSNVDIIKVAVKNGNIRCDDPNEELDRVLD